MSVLLHCTVHNTTLKGQIQYNACIVRTLISLGFYNDRYNEGPVQCIWTVQLDHSPDTITDWCRSQRESGLVTRRRHHCCSSCTVAVIMLRVMSSVTCWHDWRKLGGDGMFVLQTLADSWTDEFTRLEHEAHFWERLQKQWDDLNGLVSCQFL